MNTSPMREPEAMAKSRDVRAAGNLLMPLIFSASSRAIQPPPRHLLLPFALFRRFFLIYHCLAERQYLPAIQPGAD